MKSSQQVLFRGQVFQNYKDFFSAYFSDTSRFQIESNLEGYIEKMVIKSVDKKDFLRLEVLLLVENGSYAHLFDLRYKHPHSPGFTKIQENNTVGFDNRYNTFKTKALEELVPQLEERLRLGWDEYRYFKEGKYYKSKVCLFSKTKPSVLIYRKTPKGLGYVILSSLFGKLYRYLNKNIKVEHKKIRPDWL